MNNQNTNLYEPPQHNLPPPGMGFSPIHSTPQYYSVEHLMSVNSILTSNIITLNQTYNSSRFALIEEINMLKKVNNDLQKNQNTNTNTNTNNNSSCDSSKNNISNPNILEKNCANVKQNKYYVKKYYPNDKSWSEKQIADFFKNLNTIEDILKLKYKWYNVRHNLKLAKMCNLLPAIEKLNNMIGLEKVKAEIFKIIIYYIQNPHANEYLHTIITGPPGVGKTQVAKIYADIFVRLGVLKTDKFIEIKRDDLVAKYLGQTAPKTRELLESAMGGVIFLDEGYSLGNDDKQDSFAKEAIDMINQYLSERKKDFMFVIAGYEEDLEKCFFSANRGLKRRFAHWIEINGYDKKEMVEIFKLKIQEQGYQLDLDLADDKKLLNFFDINYAKFENYAGDIEKFINHIKYEQSFRTFKSNEQNKIVNHLDLTLSINKFKKDKRRIIPFGLYV
jgi:ATP-dependent Clp protease ATP-binding subunit ClpA